MQVKPVLITAFSIERCLAGCMLAGLLVQMAACTSVPPNDIASPDIQVATVPTFDTWQHYPLPGKKATKFLIAKMDGRDVVVASADASASMLRRALRIEAAELGHIKFSWMVPHLIKNADIAQRQSDDSPVRIVLAFEGDRSSFSMKNVMLSELSLTLTGEALPYATLMYVWCNIRPPGTVIINPRTDRVRKMVVESGTNGLSRWLNYDRNIRADFEKAFGEPPGALMGIGLMTDTDNTRTKTRAWYGPLTLTASH